MASSEDKFLTIINAVLLPVTKDGKRTRGMNPWGQDSQILNIIANGDYQVNGFRNRDIRADIFPDLKEKDEIRRHSAKIKACEWVILIVVDVQE